MSGYPGPEHPALVPELLVADISASLRFWRDLCGFTVRYERPEEGFAYLALGTAHLMLDQEDLGRSWATGSMQRPLGRGMNLQIAVPDVAPLLDALRRAGIRLFLEPEERWYRIGEEEAGQRQFLVMDPDGYLVRFQFSIGRRRAG